MTEQQRNLAAEQQAAGTDRDRDDPAAAPETEGIPEYADDDAPANRQVPDPRRQPVPGEHPVAVDDYGTTANETRHGEPLSGRLARERSDVGEEAIPDERRYDAGMRTEPTGDDEVAEAPVDAEVIGESRVEDPALTDILETDDPRTESPVSVYDRMDRSAHTDEGVGAGPSAATEPCRPAPPGAAKPDVAGQEG